MTGPAAGPMLAYVFWHQPLEGGARDDYERSLVEFHRVLTSDPPAGFLGSATYSLPGAPWAPRGAVYEDWYLVRDSASLDPLNEAAVSGRRGPPHDRVARRAGWGAAGLYRLRLGTPRLRDVGTAVWFAKPAGEGYPELFRALEPVVAADGSAVWGRQMVLGPTPEFCLHAPVEPGELPIEVVQRLAPTLLWCSPGGSEGARR